MDEQRAPLHFHRGEASRVSEIERVRRPPPTDERGPYETTYTISRGYPEREIVTQ